MTLWSGRGRAGKKVTAVTFRCPTVPMAAVSNLSVTVTTEPETLTAPMTAVSYLSAEPKTGYVENKEDAPATISQEYSMTCE